MKCSRAILHLGNEYVTAKTELDFMILRAAHYLAEFRDVTDLYMNIRQPDDVILQIWKKSLERKKQNIVLHFSHPTDLANQFFAAPDFPMLLISENGSRHVVNLNIPAIPGLTDFHLHTHLAYCSENMNVTTALKLEHLSGVKYVNFSEHSGQLFCTSDTYWNNRFVWEKRNPADDRSACYTALAEDSARPGLSFGLELDVDKNAEVTDVRSPALSGFRLGAIHFLGIDLSYKEKKQDFMRRLDALLASGIDILAHPFRVFPKGGIPVPEDLFEPVAEKLIKAHVAAEINFHTNQPQPEFVELILKKGGKISFGTDSHNLYEAGYLKPHYEFCQQLGVAGKLDKILLSAVTRGAK